MICKLLTSGEYETAANNALGELYPKDGKIWKVFLQTDNPDISSLTTEARLIRQALEEYQRRLPYKIKVYTKLEGPIDEMDVTIDFIEPDGHMSMNTLAYAGYPFGSLRGRIRMNNRFAWLDGKPKYGYELRAMGIILPQMDDARKYKTYNVRQTIKHEFGHILGIPHSEDDEAVMRAWYDENNILLKETTLGLLEVKYGSRNLSSRWLSYIISSIKRQVFK